MGAKGGVGATTGWARHFDVLCDGNNTSLVLTFRSLLLNLLALKVREGRRGRDLNSEFSFINPSIITKCLQEVFGTLPEGSVSQNFYLCSRYFFMLCRNV